MAELVTIGETMAALSPNRIGPLRHAGTLELSIAGAESTVAIGASRLGRTAAWVGRLGADEFGQLVRMTLRGEGVDVHAAVDPAAPTGLMIKERRTADRRRVHYYRAHSAGSRLGPDDIPHRLIERAAVLHTTAITLALSGSAGATVHDAVHRARAAGVTVSFDANHRAKLWQLPEYRQAVTVLMPQLDLLFASLDEAQSLLRTDNTDPAELAGMLLDRGPRTVVITLGARGALSAGPSGVVRTDAVRVSETDPVGAGDSFVAGYLCAVLAGRDERGRLGLAAQVAAYSVSAQGDWEGLPTADELAQTPAATDVSR
ncbi:sugar kinase [Kitasatospora sp. NPDC087314]|uniref:sugar kinase n=1 Tax=Kitasatospora sp. NPDC087314 TaxID=3364068 RepID=UPI00382DE34B